MLREAERHVQAQRRKKLCQQAASGRKTGQATEVVSSKPRRVVQVQSLAPARRASSVDARRGHAGSGLGSRARRAGTRRWAGTAPRVSGPAPAAARSLPTHDPPCRARASDAPVEPQSGAPAAAVPGGARGLAHAHADGNGGASRRRWRRLRTAHRGTRRLRLASLRLTDLRQRGLHRAATL